MQQQVTVEDDIDHFVNNRCSSTILSKDRNIANKLYSNLIK